MSILVIVEHLKDWPISIDGVEIVLAKDYLTDSKYQGMKGMKVFNFCRSYSYQTMGYYVSLLASARKHRALPPISTILDMKTKPVVRIIAEDLDELVEKNLANIISSEFILSIYFSKNIAQKYDRLCARLFSLFPSPLLRAKFIRDEKTQKWTLYSVKPISMSDIPEAHLSFFYECAKQYFEKKPHSSIKKAQTWYDMAILYNEKDKNPPSCPKAIERFIKAARSLSIYCEVITKDNYGSIAEFDALFIRETTKVNHHTFRFSKRAEAEGLVVIDDPDSILKCTNKVYLSELLSHNKIPTPKTLVISSDNWKKIPELLTPPYIIKQPDSSFSQGVFKIDSIEDLQPVIERLFDESDLLIAQEFIRTDFDWRVGIFNQQPLYVCKYYMVNKHWQIRKQDANGNTEDGKYETLSVHTAPTPVIELALKSANLIGDGLYGADIKQAGDNFYVIEINDNPSIDAGIEDQYLRDKLYIEIMKGFLKRLQMKR